MARLFGQFFQKRHPFDEYAHQPKVNLQTAAADRLRKKRIKDAQAENLLLRKQLTALTKVFSEYPEVGDVFTQNAELRLRIRQLHQLFIEASNRPQVRSAMRHSRSSINTEGFDNMYHNIMDRRPKPEHIRWYRHQTDYNANGFGNYQMA